MSDSTINCRFCRGHRPTDGKRCLGCGAPVAHAILRQRPRVQVERHCPSCHRKTYRTIEPGRFECVNCLAQFEDDDFSYVDTRPEQNAMKKERRS